MRAHQLCVVRRDEQHPMPAVDQRVDYGAQRVALPDTGQSEGEYIGGRLEIRPAARVCS